MTKITLYWGLSDFYDWGTQEKAYVDSKCIPDQDTSVSPRHFHKFLLGKNILQVTILGKEHVLS